MRLWPAFIMLCATMSAIAAPRVACDFPDFDFGRQPSIRPVRHSFLIRNTGDTPLTIKRIDVTCGCLVAGQITNAIPHGGETALEVRMNLRGLNGSIKKTLYVVSDDPAQPPLQLIMRGEVFPEFEIMPRIVVFSPTGTMTTSMEREVRIQADGEVRLRIVEYGMRSNSCAVTMFEDAPGRAYRFRLSTTAVPALKMDYLTIRTDHPRYREVVVPVRFALVEDGIVIPAVIVVSTNGLTVPVRLIVQSRSGSSFAITGVKAPFPGVRMETTRLAADRWQVAVEELPGTAAGQDIVIKTDLPSMNEINVPVEGDLP